MKYKTRLMRTTGVLSRSVLWMKSMTTKLRSSNEMLAAFRKSEGKEPCVKGRSNRTKETYAPQGNKETCVNPLSNPPSHSLSKKTVIPTSKMEMDCNRRQSFTRKKFVDANIQDGHKNGTSTRSRRTRTRWIISLGYREIGVAKGVCKIWRQEMIHEGSSKKRVEYCLDHNNEQSQDTLVVFQYHTCSPECPRPKVIIGRTAIQAQFFVSLFSPYNVIAH